MLDRSGRARSRLPILTAALIATLVDVLVAIPALRVRGVNLAIVTLAFAIAVDKAVFTNSSVNGGFFGAKVTTPKIDTESSRCEVRDRRADDRRRQDPNP